MYTCHVASIVLHAIYTFTYVQYINACLYFYIGNCMQRNVHMLLTLWGNLWGNCRKFRASTELLCSVKIYIDLLVYQKYLRSCLVLSLRSTAAWTPHVLLDDVVHCAIYSWMMPYTARTFRVLMQYTLIFVVNILVGSTVLSTSSSLPWSKYQLQGIASAPLDLISVHIESI